MVTWAIVINKHECVLIITEKTGLHSSFVIILIIQTSNSFCLPGKSHGRRSLVGCSPWGRKELDTTERLHFQFSLHALEKEMATHSSVLAWRIPGTGEPGGLPSMGSHRVRHYWSDLAAAAACHVTSSPEWGDHGNRINVSKNQVSPRCITAHNLPR